MKKLILIILSGILFTSCCYDTVRTCRIVDQREDLYVKGISVHITGGGRVPVRKYWRYHIGTLLGNDTIFTIQGGEILSNNPVEELDYKIGDLILKGKE